MEDKEYYIVDDPKAGPEVLASYTDTDLLLRVAAYLLINQEDPVGKALWQEVIARIGRPPERRVP